MFLKTHNDTQYVTTAAKESLMQWLSVHGSQRFLLRLFPWALYFLLVEDNFKGDALNINMTDHWCFISTETSPECTGAWLSCQLRSQRDLSLWSRSPLEKWTCNQEKQIWLHIGSISFTLTFVLYCFCCKLGESDTTERLHFHALEKEMAADSSVLAWRIPGMGEPGGLPSMGSHRLDTTEVT